MGMSFVHVIVCCLIIFNGSEGRIVQGIIGRNVSISWTFNNIGKDAIRIMHDTSLFLRVWPFNNYSDPLEQQDRMRAAVDTIANGTVTLTVNFLNITKKDAGMYKVKRQWESEEFSDSIRLETIDETMIPKIGIVRQTVLDSNLVLECGLSNMSIGKIYWRLNESLIETHSRYYQNNTFLSIKNLTAGDQYSLYKCIDSGSGLQSDPYNIHISGPNTITIAPYITMVTEHSVLSASCLADCYPICSWSWIKLDSSSDREKVISAEKVLYIQNSTRQDAGTYSCRVHNKITGVSLENFTSLKIIYGPDAVLLNSSDKIIQLGTNGSVTISCSADCFPPCQIGWTATHAESLIPTAEMKLVSVNRDGNYTCHAMNPRKDNTKISDTVYVILKSDIHVVTANQTHERLDEDAINTSTTFMNDKTSYYMTTALNRKADTEDFPSKRQLVYSVVGMGAVLAVTFLVSLLRKIRICLRVKGGVNINTVTESNINDDDNLQVENLPGNYWTIISNARGELTTAIEIVSGISREPPLIGEITIATDNEPEQSIRSDDFILNEECDEYLSPIHSATLELDEYIHPV